MLMRRVRWRQSPLKNENNLHVHKSALQISPRFKRGIWDPKKPFKSKRSSLPNIHFDQSGVKLDIVKKYGWIFERNLPMLTKVSGFSRAQLIHYFTLYKALLQLNKTRIEGLEFDTFKAALGEMILSNEDFARKLFEAWKDKRIEGSYLTWSNFLTAVKVLKDREFVEDSSIIIKHTRY